MKKITLQMCSMAAGSGFGGKPKSRATAGAKGSREEKWFL